MERKHTMKGEGSHVNSDDFTPSLAREREKLWSGRKKERAGRERAGKQSDYVERHESRMMNGGRRKSLS